MNPTTSPDTTEARLLTSARHVGQVAAVGRTNDGSVTLRMTPAAAGVLAAILQRYDHAHHLLSAHLTADNYDPTLWNHVAIDLTSAKVMALHGPWDAQRVAQVPIVHPSQRGGVIHSVSFEGREQIHRVAELDLGSQARG